MNNNWVKKGLVVSVILLFIGIAVAPSITFNVAKASNDNDLVEVTTQACGINGFGNTTVKLTKQQYRSLEQYLVDFRARLNQTTTREETVSIFREAVIELDKFGLLPKGMTIKQAQKLVTSQSQNKKIMKLQERMLNNNLLIQDNNSNYLCLIAGKSNPIANCFFYSPFFSLDEIVKDFVKILIIRFLYFILPIKLLSNIIFGYKVDYGGVEEHPYQGYIYSIGLSGVKIWSGNLYGGISEIIIKDNALSKITIFYTGTIGFIGINIGGLFFLGTAMYVKKS